MSQVEMNAERIGRVLAKIPRVHAWLVHQRSVESVELFFIGRRLDMHRGKQVRRIDLTVYHDFQEDERELRGSFSLQIHPTMDRPELLRQVDRGIEAARYVRNPRYPLVTPAMLSARPGRPGEPPAGRSAAEPPTAPSPAAAAYPCGSIEAAIRSLFREDLFAEGRINSAELFLQRTDHVLLNSEGLDVQFRQDQGALEVVTHWRGPGEEVELIGQVRFPGEPGDILARTVREQLEASRDRAQARPTPARTGLPILLSGEPVREFLEYYRAQTSAENVYKQVSSAQVGRPIQQPAEEADALTLSLDPWMPESPDSAPFDPDGYPLAPVNLIEGGVVRRLWGSLRFSSYLGIPPTGLVPNVRIEPGRRTLEELRRAPHLELQYFSDFQCDTTTGDFGGEIRLGYLFDGDRRMPVSGGSIGGNVLEVQRSMLLSREIQQKESFRGPRAVLLSGVSISGA